MRSSLRRAASKPLDRSFYNRHPVRVAEDLLGLRLLRQIGKQVLEGRIVEVEAYLAQEDPACHAFRGPTRRNTSMFGPAGHAYVYSIHARYCLNLVTEPEGTPSAILIRAVEPLRGQQRMRRNRGIDNDLDLARGPARLCEAFQIDRSLDGWDLTLGSKLWVEAARRCEPLPIATTCRIGVTSAKELPLRFVVHGSRFLSRRVR